MKKTLYPILLLLIFSCGQSTAIFIGVYKGESLNKLHHKKGQVILDIRTIDAKTSETRAEIYWTDGLYGQGNMTGTVNDKKINLKGIVIADTTGGAWDTELNGEFIGDTIKCTYHSSPRLGNPSVPQEGEFNAVKSHTKLNISAQANKSPQNALNKRNNDVKNEVASSNGSNISAAVVANPVSTIKINNELAGIWEYSEQNTDDYGIKTTRVSVWEFKSNGKWIFDIWNNYMKKPIHGVSSYSYANNILTEYNNSKTKIGENKILWEDDYNSFTVDSENSFDGTNYFVRVSKNQFGVVPIIPPKSKDLCKICWGSKSDQCGICAGTGKVRHRVQRERYNANTDRYELYDDYEYENCHATDCNNGRVTCFACKGKGY